MMPDPMGSRRPGFWQMQAAVRTSMEPLEPRMLLSVAGDLDTTFNTTGKLITNMGASGDHIQAVAIDNTIGNGDIVAAGTGNTGGHLALAVYKPDGSLDTSFGTGGKFDFGIGTSGATQANAIYILGNGSILVGGFANNTTTGDDFLVAKITSAGALDTSFGSGGTGYTTTNFTGSSIDRANAITVDSSGNIFLGGYSQVISGSTGKDSALAKYDSSGNLVSAFGSSGTQVISFGNNSIIDDQINGVVALSSGKIVVAGQARNDFLLRNLLLREPWIHPRALVPAVRGKSSLPWIAGRTVPQDLSSIPPAHLLLADSPGLMLPWHVTPAAGAIDTSFGTSSGFTLTAIGGRDTSTSVSLATAPDGKYVLAGTTTGDDFAIARYSSTGAIDTSFGTSGLATVDIGGSDVANSVVVQSDRKVVVAGYTDKNSASRG